MLRSRICGNREAMIAARDPSGWPPSGTGFSDCPWSTALGQRREGSLPQSAAAPARVRRSSRSKRKLAPAFARRRPVWVLRNELLPVGHIRSTPQSYQRQHPLDRNIADRGIAITKDRQSALSRTARGRPASDVQWFRSRVRARAASIVRLGLLVAM